MNLNNDIYTTKTSFMDTVVELGVTEHQEEVVESCEQDDDIFDAETIIDTDQEREEEDYLDIDPNSGVLAVIECHESIDYIFNILDKFGKGVCGPYNIIRKKKKCTNFTLVPMPLSIYEEIENASAEEVGSIKAIELFDPRRRDGSYPNEEKSQTSDLYVSIYGNEKYKDGSTVSPDEIKTEIGYVLEYFVSLNMLPKDSYTISMHLQNRELHSNSPKRLNIYFRDVDVDDIVIVKSFIHGYQVLDGMFLNVSWYERKQKKEEKEKEKKQVKPKLIIQRDEVKEEERRQTEYAKAIRYMKGTHVSHVKIEEEESEPSSNKNKGKKRGKGRK